jgi:hypothetical protein
VHLEGRHGLFGISKVKGMERHDVLSFSATSFVHERQHDNVSAQHVAFRAGQKRRTFREAALNSDQTAGLRGRGGFWSRSTVHHELFTSSERIELDSLVSAESAFVSSGDDDPSLYVRFNDAHGGNLSLPASPPFAQSTRWAPLLRDALAHAGVSVEGQVSAVLDAWCEGRRFVKK